MQQMEQQKYEADVHQAARRDMMKDYKNFLDAQKFGNATLKEQMLDPDINAGNAFASRRMMMNTMLPPRSQIGPNNGAGNNSNSVS